MPRRANGWNLAQPRIDTGLRGARTPRPVDANPNLTSTDNDIDLDEQMPVTTRVSDKDNEIQQNEA